MNKKRSLLVFLLLIFLNVLLWTQVPVWSKHEIPFTSDSLYSNPLYDVKEFYATFLSPSGRTIRISGFWDGDDQFKIRFAPDELGDWSYTTTCADQGNAGLHAVKGSFECVENRSPLEIYRRGSIKRNTGAYHLSYNDGTPFFYVGCTAWNGALKSTDEEWQQYLSHRAANHYSVIQFVTTQWRGCEHDSKGEVAFTGSGRIEINTDFFKRLDDKIDQINAHGLVAAPVLLWALQFGDGRHLSPGYFLPENEAVLLAQYMVARFGANQVIWILGGDGRYINEYEQRWKNIGRRVFADAHPGIVAQHPQGSSWIGEAYKDEHWLDIVGYQSSHNNSERVVDWINKGPMAETWDKLPARPLMNMEPNYEEIYFRFTAEDVRNASYWSIFATPISGITYGANGIWPWIQKEGELIENHRNPGGKGPSTWKESIDFPGSLQIGYLSAFIQQYEWWNLMPNPDILVYQPGEEVYNHFISVVSDPLLKSVVFYTPVRQEIKIRNRLSKEYKLLWFDPITNKMVGGGVYDDSLISIVPPAEQDYVGVLEEIGN